MKIGIYSPITPISMKPGSHRSGWPRMLQAQIRVAGIESEIFTGDHPTLEEAQACEAILIYHGHEFDLSSKSLNYFLKEPESYDKLARRFEMLYAILTGCLKVYSVDTVFPMYGTLARSRSGPRATERYNSLPFDDLDMLLKQRNSRNMIYGQRVREEKHLVIGDSHSTSVWRPGARVNRTDFKTLHGALNIGLDAFVADYGKVNSVTTYFGNIDVRHHFGRMAKPFEAIDDICAKYEKQLQGLDMDYTEIIAPMPIEPESRVLPKSGHYKGQPFWGTWEERNGFRLRMITNLEIIAHRNGFRLYQWPDEYVDEEGRLKESVMEKPRSVHLSPEFYAWGRPL